MHTKRSIRPYVIGTPLSRSMFAIIRVLIGSYFLAVGTGLILEPSSRSLFDGVMPTETAAVTTTFYLFVTAFMIMVGKAVRPAALLLAIYIFWSAFVHFEFGTSAEGLTSFWRDMALLGAILLVAVTEPGGSDSFHLWRTGIAPRRIVPQGPAAPDIPAAAMKPSRPAPAWNLSARDAVQATPVAPRHADGTPDAEDRNIFADLWDTPVTHPMPGGLRPHA